MMLMMLMRGTPFEQSAPSIAVSSIPEPTPGCGFLLEILKSRLFPSVPYTSTKYLPSRSLRPPNLASATAAGLCSLVGCGERAHHRDANPHSAADETNETNETNETGRRASPDGRPHGPVWALRVPSAGDWLATAPPIEDARGTYCTVPLLIYYGS